MDFQFTLLAIRIIIMPVDSYLTVATSNFVIRELVVNDYAELNGVILQSWLMLHFCHYIEIEL